MFLFQSILRFRGPFITCPTEEKNKVLITDQSSTPASPSTRISVSSSPATPPTTVVCPESEAPQLLPRSGKLRGSLPCSLSRELLENPPVLQSLPSTQTTHIISCIYRTFSPALCRQLCPLVLSNCCLVFPQGRKEVLSDKRRSCLGIGRLCVLGKIALSVWVSWYFSNPG